MAKSTLFYRLFGFWIRREALRLAALTFSGAADPDAGWAPVCWSLTVFFENYMIEGAEGTLEDFGPKEPAELHVVNDERTCS